MWNLLENDLKSKRETNKKARNCCVPTADELVYPTWWPLLATSQDYYGQIYYKLGGKLGTRMTFL